MEKITDNRDDRDKRKGRERERKGASVMCHRGKKNARGEAPSANLGRSSLTAALTAVSARVIPIYHRTTSCTMGFIQFDPMN